jgi:hypothetical protein
MIQDEKLNLTVFFRSHDMTQGWPENAYGCAAIQKEIADAINAETGILTIISGSAQIYNNYYQQVEEMLKKYYPRKNYGSGIRGSNGVRSECKYCERTPRIKLEDRFWRMVDKQGDDECWNWRGYKNIKGHGRFSLKANFRYGSFSIGHKNIGAHRMAYILTYGEIPDGIFICHKCNNSSCVNPKHLYPGTQLDNMQDRKIAGHYSHTNYYNRRRNNP